MVRATGRTTRMMEEVMRLSEQGRAVYVIMASKSACDAMESKYGELHVRFETAGTLGNFDWDRMILLGAHPNCVVLVDHFAIESRFAAMLEMLHRFDTPTQDQNP